jgi:metallo-beta-lactamase class B
MSLKAVVFLLLFTSLAVGQLSEEDREWNAPVEPFRIIGNVYYVGAAEVTSFLITTPKGHFLIDSGYAETVPQIRANIATLGFKFEDIKVLLNTQAHYDHAGGFAEIKRATGARLISSVRDKPALERGGREDFTWGDTLSYEGVAVDKVVANNDRVTFGGVTMRSVITPGHTKGCTTWLLTVKQHGRRYQVIFVGSTTSPGYKFYGNDRYPNIVSDFKKTFSVMKNLRPDVFLASHGSFFDLLGKAEAARNRPAVNPFIDREGYREFVRDTETQFKEKLTKERMAMRNRRPNRPVR